MKRRMTRREALRWMALAAAGTLAACQNVTEKTAAAVEPTAAPTQPPAPSATPQPTSTPEPKLPAVYMTTAISSAALLAMYETLGVKAHGNVAVKISSGEPGGNYYLHPELIEPLVKAVNGTIVECNTAYGGRRDSTESHRKAIEDHGFNAIAPTDIMDAEGVMTLPIAGGTHLKEDEVGAHLANYDFVINLAHFKGHMMAGFGGVLKNMSIGIASSQGKSLIHSAGRSRFGIGSGTPQDHFLESMAEAAKGVADYLGKNIVYINVMNNLSVDCDCDSGPAKPTMADIGILASLDPVALDQACVDLVYAAPDGKDLIARMESKHGIRILEHGEAIGLGSRKYELVSVD